MSAFNPPKNYARWIVFGAAGVITTYLLYKTYQTQFQKSSSQTILSADDLTDDDKEILGKYKYQLKIGIGRGKVKRTMNRLGDKHLIPILFPGEDPNDFSQKSKSKKGKANRNRLGKAYDADSERYYTQYAKAPAIEMFEKHWRIRHESCGLANRVP